MPCVEDIEKRRGIMPALRSVPPSPVRHSAKGSHRSVCHHELRGNNGTGDPHKAGTRIDLSRIQLNEQVGRSVESPKN